MLQNGDINNDFGVSVCLCLIIMSCVSCSVIFNSCKKRETKRKLTAIIRAGVKISEALTYIDHVQHVQSNNHFICTPCFTKVSQIYRLKKSLSQAQIDLTKYITNKQCAATATAKKRTATSPPPSVVAKRGRVATTTEFTVTRVNY